MAWLDSIAGHDPFGLILNGDLIEGDHHRTDQIIGRNISDETYAELSAHLNRQQIIEFCALAGHYDAIAAILATLRVPMDFPD